MFFSYIHLNTIIIEKIIYFLIILKVPPLNFSIPPKNFMIPTLKQKPNTTKPRKPTYEFSELLRAD